MDTKKIIKHMTNEEKLAFCTGADYWHTVELPRFAVPSIMMSDGPHGIRAQANGGDAIGVNKAQSATCFPTAVTAGATWDPALYAEEGEAIGREALAMGISVVLGPGCNIKRDPRGGRNFEYLSEDPYLSGQMAAAFIRGQQSTGVSSCVKHFAVNNQEYKRQNGDSRVDERTLREIYLTPFEIAIREGRPETVMCAYNKINGTHASDNRRLLTNILREEWGFDGTVITDWGALHNRVEAFAAGCDLDMPGGMRYLESDTAQALEIGVLEKEMLDESVERILRLVSKERPLGGMPDLKANRALARRIAEAGAVLLKNEDGVLPARSADMVFIGAMADAPRYQGNGSSHIRPWFAESVTAALPHVPYEPCSDVNGRVTDGDLERARELAAGTRTPVVFVGLPAYIESEGFDRADLSLPEGYNRLVTAVAEVNPNTVVVLFGGGVMELPWADHVKAILYMGLAGGAVGTAVARLLLGQANPSGKLTESWPYRYEDGVSHLTFGMRDPEYLEGPYVGYRYYDSAGIPVRYSFGHGLSYTTFAYSDLSVADGCVSLTVKNTGARAGAEVVQLYVSPPKGGVFRPAHALCGFTKVALAAGESKQVSIPIYERAFSVYHNGAFRTLAGEYTLSVGASLSDLRLSTVLRVEGEEIPAPAWQKGSFYETLKGYPEREEWEKLVGHPVAPGRLPARGYYTMENSILEMRETSVFMRLVVPFVKLGVRFRYHGRCGRYDPTYRFLVGAALDSPLRSAVICSEGAFKAHTANAFVHMANRHPIRAIRAFFKRY